MPRLFPNLGRSSKDRQYDGYDAPHGYYDYGYPEQASHQHRSAWSKVLHRKSTKRDYVREDPGPHSYPGGYRTTMEDYPEDPHVHPGMDPRVHPGMDPRVHPGMVPDEYGESFEDLLSGRHSDTAIPLVQRESSLTRLQQAFADNGTYAPAMSAAPSMSMYPPQPPMAGRPHVSAVNDLHQPAMLVNSPVQTQGLHPDVVHHSASYPTTRDRPHRRHREHERERSAPPRSYRDGREHPAYWENPLDPAEEPPVVVVVEHGKNGKKDKYYIIPGGAPVIFEDEDGNELTRVGDFSGHYRPPQRPRPVIVQDQYGNEICRGGFSNDDHISVGSRDNYTHRSSRSAHSDHRGRPTHRSQDQRGHSSHHTSSHSSRMFATDSYHHDPHYQPSRPRAGTRSSRDDPEVVFLDPNQGRTARSHRSGSSSDTLVRSSPRDHHSSSGRSHDRPREYPDERGRERERERERGRDYHRRDHDSRRPSSSRSGSDDYYDDRRYRDRERERRHRYDRYGQYDYD